VDLVKEAMTIAIEKYRKATNGTKDVKVNLDTEKYLSSESSGGVELLNRNEKIKVVNTLDSRLDLIFQQMLPELRDILFGRNPNRRFTD